MGFPKPGLGWLPVLWSMFAGIALAICYSIATAHKHIYPLIPSISDTGLKVPENAIFSESFNFIAYSVLVLMVIRYFQVREVLATGAVEEAPKENMLKNLNKGSIILGSLAAFGATLVGNFKSERVRSSCVLCCVPKYMKFYTDWFCLWYSSGYLWSHIYQLSIYSISMRSNGRFHGSDYSIRTIQFNSIYFQYHRIYILYLWTTLHDIYIYITINIV